MRVRPLPLMNDGKTQMPCQVGAGGGFISKGAKNVEVAKDFMRFFYSQPQVMNENLKSGLGRWFPSIPAGREGHPWWLDHSEDLHRKPYITKGVLSRPSPPGTASIPHGGCPMPSSSGDAPMPMLSRAAEPADAVDAAFRRFGDLRQGIFQLRLLAGLSCDQPGELGQLVRLDIRYRVIPDAVLPPGDDVSSLPRLIPERLVRPPKKPTQTG